MMKKEDQELIDSNLVSIIDKTIAFCAGYFSNLPDDIEGAKKAAKNEFWTLLLEERSNIQATSLPSLESSRGILIPAGTLKVGDEIGWTKGCVCKEDDKHGETWCCNHCGLPTSNHSKPTFSEIADTAVEFMKTLPPFKRPVINLKEVDEVVQELSHQLHYHEINNKRSDEFIEKTRTKIGYSLTDLPNENLKKTV